MPPSSGNQQYERRAGGHSARFLTRRLSGTRRLVSAWLRSKPRGERVINCELCPAWHAATARTARNAAQIDGEGSRKTKRGGISTNRGAHKTRTGSNLIRRAGAEPLPKPHANAHTGARIRRRAWAEGRGQAFGQGGACGVRAHGSSDDGYLVLAVRSPGR